MGDSAEMIHFSHLNNSNYAQWAVNMEAVLICQGLWSLVSITVDTAGKDAAVIGAEIEDLKKKRSADKMAEVRAEMVLRVDDGQLSHMCSEDPMEIWQTLRHVHHAAGFCDWSSTLKKILDNEEGG